MPAIYPIQGRSSENRPVPNRSTEDTAAANRSPRDREIRDGEIQGNESEDIESLRRVALRHAPRYVVTVRLSPNSAVLIAGPRPRIWPQQQT